MLKIILFFFLPLSLFSLSSQEKDCLLAIKEGRGEFKQTCSIENIKQINFLDEQQSPPLYYAIALGNKEAFFYLLRRGASPFIKTAQWTNALHIAAIYNRLELLGVLLQKGVFIDSLDQEGNTPFMLASASGSLAFVEALFEKGANKNHTNEKNQNAFLLASQSGELDVMEFLFKKGVDIHLGSYIDGNESIHEAVLNHQLAAVEFLLNHRVDINTKSGYTGMTPLLYSIFKGDQDIFNILIKRGANIEKQDFQGNTPLHWAALGNHLFMVKTLLDKGAQVQLENKSGLKPVDIAKNRRFSELLIFLK